MQPDNGLFCPSRCLGLQCYASAGFVERKVACFSCGFQRPKRVEKIAKVVTGQNTDSLARSPSLLSQQAASFFESDTYVAWPADG